MTSYTPGPWVNDGGLVTGQESRTSHPLPSIDIFDASEWDVELADEARANAALIAAAPDLLDALQRCAAILASMGVATQFSALDAARAAIRKATTP